VKPLAPRASGLTLGPQRRVRGAEGDRRRAPDYGRRRSQIRGKAKVESRNAKGDGARQRGDGAAVNGYRWAVGAAPKQSGYLAAKRRKERSAVDGSSIIGGQLSVVSEAISGPQRARRLAAPGMDSPRTARRTRSGEARARVRWHAHERGSPAAAAGSSRGARCFGLGLKAEGLELLSVICGR
jgi:hypothetical protein